MSRKRKERCCRFLDEVKIFKPRSISIKDSPIIYLNLDEFEAVRLCDYDMCSQIEAAGSMNISRGTVQRLLESGRFKIIDAILNNKALQINNK